MRLGDNKLGYGVLSMLNHWIIGIVIVCLIFFGIMSSGMENGPDRLRIITLHKAAGVLVLMLAIWRIIWRLRQGFPNPSPDHPAWRNHAALWMHWFLMVAIIAMPLSGIFWTLTAGRPISIFGLFEIPAMVEMPDLSDALQSIHRMLSKFLIAGIIIHSLAGIYHSATDFGKSGGRMFTPK